MATRLVGGRGEDDPESLVTRGAFSTAVLCRLERDYLGRLIQFEPLLQSADFAHWPLTAILRVFS